jgi:hypothetical protein
VAPPPAAPQGLDFAAEYAAIDGEAMVEEEEDVQVDRVSFNV